MGKIETIQLILPLSFADRWFRALLLHYQYTGRCPVLEYTRLSALTNNSNSFLKLGKSKSLFKFWTLSIGKLYINNERYL